MGKEMTTSDSSTTDVHVLPEKDLHDHVESRACWCRPRLIPPPVTPEPLGMAKDAALQAWRDWKKTLTNSAFTHSDGVRFVQILDARFEPLELEARAARTSLWQKVTRVEVIAERGRAFTRWDCHLEHTDSMFQDDGRTLKLFVKGGTPTSPPAQGRRTGAVNDLPSIEEMAGSVSDVTGGQTLKDFMRWLRGE